MAEKKSTPRIARALTNLTIMHTNELIKQGEICDLSHLTPEEWMLLIQRGYIETADGKPVNKFVPRPVKTKAK